jgi:hypothetical protein
VVWVEFIDQSGIDRDWDGLALCSSICIDICAWVSSSWRWVLLTALVVVASASIHLFVFKEYSCSVYIMR